MLKHKDHFHGSDLEKIEQIYGIRKEEITNFSANVNPLGISPNLKQTLASHLDAITTYPDREYASLRHCIAEYAHTDFENIIVGNGSTELISLFIQIERPKKAMVLGPTYSEYEREIFLGGGATHYYPLKEENGFCLDLLDFIGHLNESIDLLVICNPNNPTSSSVSREEMRRILDVCKQYDIFVMVDETYVEFAEDMDAVTSVPLTHYYNNIIILRGTSKFFASPGLRLGYAITGNRDLIKSINTRQNPWTINSLAVIAGELMFSDQGYIRETRKLISAERARMYRVLQDSKKFAVYEPSANFMLAKILKDGIRSQDLFERAIRERMMIRDCSTFPFLDQKFVRFCVMKPEDNDRLLECLMG
ncbi:MAG: aminotransferase class I/II-fold pyridoxal phosphate-dependent enzyme [Eubacterium sp.]|jgi:threonine-phosphate decarboxylase|nr:aminotransferase class I/II-fold pyridoxal phosphate-dependent enzyme [Eubacterium sp.]NBI86060.1 aminotransferase class I/II-fold pyridoxal phosphate-dependent enzyme [Lachnospiraceae bacterium]